ncbi:MAG: (R,R)-butanediol dehydrogenase / meso-butanediol dehydrogenase / diacetyl reductase [Actinomycetota bacterium]|nr:(R,R)-butanediol dehydrogenase / meso-butanediol dehydrogenase / diacetyl reductase [Actinomycetota bacterium]
MRAVSVLPGGELAVVDKPDPTPGEGEVVIAVERCGICGSDLHLKSSGLIGPGAVMGHEFCGRVVDRGAGTDGVAEGDLVSVLPSGRCGVCALCVSGRSELCPAQAMTAIGLGFNDGAYAEFCKAPVRSCYPIPDGMTVEQGALVEPYAVALHAVHRSRVVADPGLKVGVIGAGPIGLLTVAALRGEGATNVVVAERAEMRAELASSMGAASLVSNAGALATAFGGEQPDVIFDCAGSPLTPPLALEAVTAGGEIVLVGVVDIGQTLDMPGLLWIIKQVDVRSSIAYTDEEFGQSVDAVAKGVIDPAVLVSDTRPLAAAQASFDDLAAGRAVKLLLSPALG